MVNTILGSENYYMKYLLDSSVHDSIHGFFGNNVDYLDNLYNILVMQGHTIPVIEHNADIHARADAISELLYVRDGLSTLHIVENSELESYIDWMCTY